MKIRFLILGILIICSCSREEKKDEVIYKVINECQSEQKINELEHLIELSINHYKLASYYNFNVSKNLPIYALIKENELTEFKIQNVCCFGHPLIFIEDNNEERKGTLLYISINKNLNLVTLSIEMIGRGIIGRFDFMKDEAGSWLLVDDEVLEGM